MSLDGHSRDKAEAQPYIGKMEVIMVGGKITVSVFGFTIIGSMSTTIGMLWQRSGSTQPLPIRLCTLWYTLVKWGVGDKYHCLLSLSMETH